jgi:hypothetical protein
VIIDGTNNGEVVDYVVTRYRELKDHRKVKEIKWMECVRAYMSDFPRIWDVRKETEMRSARFVPLSFDSVETLEATLMSMVMPEGRWIRLTPAIPGKLPYDDKAAEEMEALIYSQHQQMKFRREFKKFVKQMAIVGNAPYQVGWRQDRVVDYPAFEAAMRQWQIVHQESWGKFQQAMEDWQRLSEIAQAKGEPPPPKPSIVMPEPPPSGATQSDQIAYAGPTFMTGDIFNFVIDPFSPDRNHPIMIKRSFAPKSAIIKMSQKNEFGYSVYENTQNVEEKEIRVARDQDHMIEQYDAFGLQVPSGKAVEIKESWGTMHITNGHRDGRSVFVSFVATVANDSDLIRFEPTFMWSGESPVGMGTYRDVPGQVYGIGALEMALGVQDLVNARTNQNIDIVNFAVNPEYKAVDDGYVRSKMVSSPSKIHWVGDINNLVPLDKNLQGLNISFQDVTLLKNEFKMITKSGAPLASDSRESATKTRLDSRMLGGDVSKIALHIEDTVLTEIIQKQLELTSQYMTTEQAVRALQSGAANFKSVSPKTARQGWGVQVMGTQFSADRMERAENLMMFQQLVLGNPVALPSVKVLALLKKVYRELGFSDEDEIFNDEQTAMDILSEMIKFGMVGSPAQAPSAPEAAANV